MEFLFDHFLGTIVNFIGVIIAGVLGTLLKRGIPKRFTDIIMYAMAICVIYIGIDGILAEAPAVPEGSFLSAGLVKILIMISSMAIGCVIGELIDIDKQLTSLALALGNLFKRIVNKIGGRSKTSGVESAADGTLEAMPTDGKEQGGAPSDVDVAERFANGFVSCSLLFCVGAMAVNGAILDAQGDPSTLLAKTVIDMIVCFVMASTLGIGCAFSSLTVLVYQGAFNIVGLILSGIVSASTISYMSIVGSLIIILIGTNILGMTKIKTANMVPAMFVAIAAEAFIGLFLG
jgi:uncharacterized membrane protein YqgA involved in biofilm formation